MKQPQKPLKPCQYCGWLPADPKATELTMLAHMKARHDPTRMLDAQILVMLDNERVALERLAL